MEFDRLNLTQKYNFFDMIDIPEQYKNIILTDIENKTILKDFLKFIIQDEKHLQNQCWLWLGGKDKNKYGKKNGVAAHRIMWMYSRNKEIPNNLIIRHTCDNPPCVNPFHLRFGTIQDNANDMKNRGRSLFGEKHPDALLTDEQVKNILYDLYYGKSIISIAKNYNVPEIIISKIANGHTRKHLFKQLEQEHIDQIRNNCNKNQLRNKLSENNVKNIRELFKTGKYTYTSLSKQFNVRVTTISNIINNLSWNNI